MLSATGTRKMSSTAQCKNLPRHTPWTELPEVSAEHLAFCIFSQLLPVRLVALVVYSCLTGISLANLEARDLPPLGEAAKTKKELDAAALPSLLVLPGLKGNTTLNSEQRTYPLLGAASIQNRSVSYGRKTHCAYHLYYQTQFFETNTRK